MRGIWIEESRELLQRGAQKVGRWGRWVPDGMLVGPDAVMPSGTAIQFRARLYIPAPAKKAKAKR